MDIFDRLELQAKRIAAYEDGEYELDNWEGFTCTECGNRQLSASIDRDSEDADSMFDSICRECGGSMETSERETDWQAVREKIPEEYMTGEAMETDLPECPHCTADITEDEESVKVSIGENSAKVHQRCAERIWEEQIENPIWFDTFTPEHYEKAADYLRSLECVGEVITHDGNLYGFGEMYVHTNYCTTAVVKDVIDAFNARVVSASVQEADSEHGFDCVDEHGTCFEILIDFCKGPTHASPEELDKYSRNKGPIWNQDHFIVDLEGQEPFFDADFSRTKKQGPEKVPDKHRD